MSLRYTSRVVYQVAMRAVQGMKDQASKSICRDSSTYGSSSKQARRFSAGSGGALDSSSTIKAAAAAKTDRLKQGEESLRTVMFLSCWGPN